MTAVYLFSVIMVVLVVAVIAAPLVESRRRTTDGRDGDPDPARRRQEAAIDALRELEFEYQTGKLTPEDYAPLRARYAREALAARDALGEQDPGTGEQCGTCGADVRQGARYCSRCGSALRADRV